MTYSNITYIGAYSLIAFCSVITHTILPIPPTVIFFCLSSLLALWCVKRNEFKIKSINRVSIFPLLLSSYLLLFQLLLEVPFRALVSPFLAPLYFVVALFYLSILNKRNIDNLINKFIYISLGVFIIECLWRMSHPSLPKGVDEVVVGADRWFYLFKGGGLMYSETNGLAIHIIIVYFFVVWWSLLHKKNMLIEKSCLLVLIILTFSRAALISIPLGWLYMYCIGRMSKKIQIFLFFLVLVITIAVMPTLISNLESDPSTAMKLSVFAEILEYYKHIDLLPFLYGIGNYNSMNVFSIYAHNYLLVFLVEMGFLGLLLLLFQFLFFIKVSRGQFLFVFVPFFVQVMSSTKIFIPHLYIIAAIIVYYSTYYEKDKNIIS